jgi:chromosome segregation protein
MRLTRLRLNGFKSFVDPTELVIREGLTGVVGPNGCGKSNLLEALRWVMGENRPTAMRGAGMEDVIFAGAATRPARAFAEVAITVDNTDRTAPAGFNDADTLDISRRITRDAGSAYKLNGKELRARDVQMLFADASTGAHSPALVRQGQISELINARPRARRRVLEEAAGISGLYQRRHEAELRLNATEANLSRVADVIDQLAQQLATLARQARQAQRYREIGTALRAAEGAALYRRWREAEDAREAARGVLAQALVALSAAERAAREARARREGAEDAIPPRREEEAIAGAILQRLLVQRDSLAEQEARAREAVQMLAARIEQLRADTVRESALAADADDTIARLAWEAEQIARAAEGQDARLDAASAAAREAADVLADHESALAEATEDLARLAARYQSSDRLIAEARADLARAQSGAAQAEAELQSASARLAQADEAARAAQDLVEDTQALIESSDDTLAAAEEARADAQDDEALARAALTEAETEVGTLAAEIGALERLLARDIGHAGQVLDQITVTPGYENALGAALGEDLRAPLAQDGTGWRDMGGLPDHPLPAGTVPLSQHVTAPPALARRLAQIGVCDDPAALHRALRPGQRLVTRAGDLWRWDGLVVAAQDAPSAAAQRLAQQNRLRGLGADLDAAETRRDGVRAQHETRARRFEDLQQAERLARDARRAAEARLSEASRALSRVQGERALADAGRESAARRLALSQEAGAQAQARLAEAEGARGDLDDLETARARLDGLRHGVDAARIAMMSRRAALDELRRDGAARTRRAQDIARETDDWTRRRDTAAARIRDVETRIDEAEAQLEDASAAPEDLTARRAELSDAIAQAEARRASATDALLNAESALRAAQDDERNQERAASEAREARARGETRVEASAEAVHLAAQQIAEQQNCTPQELLAHLGAPESLPDAATLELEIARLKRAREALGAVNLRAEDDARAVQGEHDTLVQEKTDLESAIAKLRGGINALNREGRERLLAAFDQVNANFATLFTHLFGGGEARLVLVESDDPLEAGLEIMCQPPGKKLSTLSLLSGGEQTLTALALIFGVFLANPAPICVLDEVDAPLDDANVVRFCDLLDEMTRRTDTRFLIITHNAITMARMDRLFGVTMAEQGVSQLVSVDLKRAEAMVA